MAVWEAHRRWRGHDRLGRRGRRWHADWEVEGGEGMAYWELEGGEGKADWEVERGEGMTNWEAHSGWRGHDRLGGRGRRGHDIWGGRYRWRRGHDILEGTYMEEMAWLPTISILLLICPFPQYLFSPILTIFQQKCHAHQY